MDFEIKKAEVPGPHYANYLLVKKPDAREVCLLLHGYAETGIYFYEKLKDSLPEHATVIAPDGPFFIPVMTRKGYRRGHSWYFYDGTTDEYIIDMSIGVEYILNIFQKENLMKMPVRIVGYSQGGYFAPFVGLRLKHTRQVIGMNSQFLDDELTDLPSFAMHALNGAKDEIVESTKSEQSVKNMSGRGIRADFELIEDGTHRLGPEFMERLNTLLKQ